MKNYSLGLAILFSFIVAPLFVFAQSTPSVDIRADESNGPITVPYGTASMLSWTSTNTSFCSGSRSGSSGTWGGTLPTSGAQGTGNLTSSNTFTISCQSPSGVVVTDSVTVNVTPAPQLIKVIAPNGGEILTIGSTYEVKNTYDYQMQPMIGYALYKGNTKLGYLAGTPISEQNFKWNVGQYLEFNSSNEVKTAVPSSDYYIGLYTPNSHPDISDAPFTITSLITPTSQPTVAFPSQGSSLEIGKRYEIRWTVSGSSASTYGIYLVGGPIGNTGSIYLGQASVSAGYFAWTVSNTISVGNNYQIQLNGVGVSGANSQSFNVVNPTRIVADVDTQPQASSCLDLSNNLRYRSRDAQTNGEVSDLQDFLQTKGYLNSEPTGYFGILTLGAVKKFQSENNISPTGFVGSITRAKIKDISCQ